MLEESIATPLTEHETQFARNSSQRRIRKMYVNYEDNRVFINGRIVSDLKFSHEFYGEGFYEFNVEIPRKSGVYDVIPVIVSERIIDVENDYSGMAVSILGQYRSCNKNVGGKGILVLSVFAFEIEIEEYVFETKDNNSILLNGYICKEPTYRRTPMGRDIADVLLAVNRGNGKSDYIPCIFWGRNAVYVSRLDVGTKIGISGRVQSREYTKAMPDGKVLDKVAYEVSVSSLEVLKDE